MPTEPTDQQENPDTSEPSAERQAELEAAYAQQQDTNAPYKGVSINTLGELLWIFQQRHWSVEVELPEGNQRPNLNWASLEGANLSGVSLARANLSRAVLTRANLSGANLRGADLSGADLALANLSGANLRGADLSGADFADADLSGADLALANLSGADLFGANLSGADLAIADLTKAKLIDAILDSKTTLVDIIWDGVNLSQINWEPIQRLGDENKPRADTPARAYRQVATQLRSQGMNEVADRFAYLAQLWQRRIMRQRLRWNNLRSLGPYLGSLLLWVVSGYGYRPGRTIMAYLLVILGFTIAYLHFGVLDASCSITGVSATGNLLATCTPMHPLGIQEAIIFSLTSFHGRGFFPGGLGLDSPITTIAAAEAVLGLLIEVTFIATFTQRFFAR